jgi:hypothetical protein
MELSTTSAAQPLPSLPALYAARIQMNSPFVFILSLTNPVHIAPAYLSKHHSNTGDYKRNDWNQTCIA